VRGISVPADAIVATAEGFNEVEDRMPLLKRIHVHYDITLPGVDGETVTRALSRHVEKCPTARSLQGSVAVTWTAELNGTRVEA